MPVHAPGTVPRDSLVGRLVARPSPRHRYPLALLAVAAATAVAFALVHLLPEDNADDNKTANLIMVYLLAVVFVASRLGAGPSIVAAVTGVTTFVALFVPHYYSLLIADLDYLPTLIIMICVSLIVSALTARLHAELEATAEREREALAMYELSRELAAVEDRRGLADVVVRNMRATFQCEASLLEWRADELHPVGGGAVPPDTLPVARQALADRRPRDAWNTRVQPLVVTNLPIGAMVCEGPEPAAFAVARRAALLASFANGVAVTLHRLAVADEAAAARQRGDEERLRNVMLNSVSHDLRTPLASITGAITTLIDSGERVDAATRLDLMQAIRKDAEALERQVRDMLDLTRLESGTLRIRREWHSLEEVAGCAIRRVDSLFAGRVLAVDVPGELPLVHLDSSLLEQLLVNLLENAVRYTPAGSPVELAARVDGTRLVVTVADRGPGIPAAERDKVFEKFHRGTTAGQRPGSGLGLAICRAIAQLHDGTIEVRERPGGGALFVVDLPTGGAQPRLDE